MAAKADIALTAERQSAARQLLAEPLVTSRGRPEDYVGVRAHAEWLSRHFRQLLGYRLDVTREYARLVKTGLVDPVTRPLNRPSGARFTPRTYTYLTLTLAALMDAPRTLSLGQLIIQVRAAATEAELPLDPTHHMAERHAFGVALRQLVRWQALTERDGEVGEYPMDGSAKTWLTVNYEIARHLVAHPPRTHIDAEELIRSVASVPPEVSDEDASGLTVRRLLVETAVVYRSDLPPEQREWLRQHQWSAVAELRAFLGCEAEVRAEGVTLILAEDAVSDGRAGVAPDFPDEGPVAQAALLLVERLAAGVRPQLLTGATTGPTHSAQGRDTPLPDSQVRTELRTLLREHGALWRRSADGYLPEPDMFTQRVLELLVDMRLLQHRPSEGPGATEAPAVDSGPAANPAPEVAVVDHQWVLRPAAARYASARALRPERAEPSGKGADTPAGEREQGQRRRSRTGEEGP